MINSSLRPVSQSTVTPSSQQQQLQRPAGEVALRQPLLMCDFVHLRRDAVTPSLIETRVFTLARMSGVVTQGASMRVSTGLSRLSPPDVSRSAKPSLRSITATQTNTAK